MKIAHLFVSNNSVVDELSMHNRGFYYTSQISMESAVIPILANTIKKLCLLRQNELSKNWKISFDSASEDSTIMKEPNTEEPLPKFRYITPNAHSTLHETTGR